MQTLFIGAAALSLAASDQAYTFSTLDPALPWRNAIASGTISGLWVDGGGLSHGFVFAAVVFSSYDVPGAGGAAAGGVTGTQGGGINSAGVIGGDDTAGGAMHGYVRNAAGIITTADTPGFIDTAYTAINDSGQITVQVDNGDPLAYRSFLRAADGTLQVIAFPGTLATGLTGINNTGVTVGGYLDAAQVVHGFIRNAVGVYQWLDDPRYELVGPWGLNSLGVAVGELDVLGASHAFVRDTQGTLTAFDFPGATYYTTAFGIDTQRDVVGQYCDATATVYHAFLATTAVPEPAAASLAALGLGALAWRHRRNARRARNRTGA